MCSQGEEGLMLQQEGCTVTASWPDFLSEGLLTCKTSVCKASQFCQMIYFPVSPQEGII